MNIQTTWLILISRATAAPQNPTYTGATPPAATNGNGNGNLVSLMAPRSFNTPVANTNPPISLRAATCLFWMFPRLCMELQEDLDA